MIFMYLHGVDCYFFTGLKPLNSMSDSLQECWNFPQSFNCNVMLNSALAHLRDLFLFIVCCQINLLLCENGENLMSPLSLKVQKFNKYTGWLIEKIHFVFDKG